MALDNCQYTVWSEWTVCSATCDGGQQSRKREILAKPSKNGIPCLEIEKIQTRRCGEVVLHNFSDSLEI